MPSDKRNLITTKAISSLFNIALSRDVPFHQLQQLQCSHHGSTKQAPVFPYSSKNLKRYFSCSSLSITMCNGASKRKYEAYWHINISLINGCGTHEIIFVVILSFEVELVSSPIYYNCHQKSKQTSIRKKL